MTRRTINILIGLAVLSFTGIILTQIYWVRQAYNVQEKETNDRIVIAMSSVVQDIMTMNKDSSVVEPVKQVSSNFYVANINDTLHPYLLETLLKDAFTSSNLRSDFEYGIYDCFNDSIVFGGKVSFRDEDQTPGEITPAEEISFQKKFDKDGHYFGIYYPHKKQMILGNMDFWIFSSLMLIFIVFIFVYAIFIILKQKRLSEVKNDFINNMTHELKTPIATIGISSQMLSQDGIENDKERLQQYAGIISTENQRLKNQVDKVLQIATLSPKQMQIKKEDLDMHAILTQATESNKLLASERGGNVFLRLSADKYHVNGDRVHLTNIFYNLIDNALKYCEGAPHVEIATSNNGRNLRIEITDNGIGIPEKYRKQIFDRFFRVPTGNVHDVKGFGLGLFYVKTIIQAHRGSISVGNATGGGSKFTIEIPHHERS